MNEELISNNDISLKDDLLNTDANPPPLNNNELLETLDQIFTPILIMHGYEDDTISKIQEAFSEAAVLTERNIIQFDGATKMAQLISVCALLISQQKNTSEFQEYKEAYAKQKSMKIQIQKIEYDEAQILAQKYLVKVSTTNTSKVARRVATELLPETQH